ncbi:MAG: hypothetical protein V3U60_16175 [Gammaproteobacteria bacterium]
MAVKRGHKFQAVESAINGKWMVFEVVDIDENAKRVRGSMREEVAERLARQMTEYHAVIASGADSWVVGNGGTEMPTKTRNGILVQVMYNAKTGQHAYLNCDSDTIMTDAEVTSAFQK